MPHLFRRTLRRQTLVLGIFKIVKSLRVKKLDNEKTSGSITDEIDRLAFRYLAPPLSLLVLGYSGYSLYTGYHKGWYSWLIESLVALVCESRQRVIERVCRCHPHGLCVTHG